MSTSSTFVPSGLKPALTKLIEVVEEENAVLTQHKVFFHSGFTDRKNQALRELMAAQRSGPSVGSVQAVRPLLQALAGALHDNARLLKLHIIAVGEISDIIVGSLRAADSDGTYSRNQPQRVR